MIADRVLVEAFGAEAGAARRAKQAVLVLAGVAALTLAAKLRVPMWPVPITMQTFAVLAIGAAYGPRLGPATVLAYLAVGAAGADVFTGSSAAESGVAYVLGSTGGYLLGFALAAAVLGQFARAGWDRSPGRMALALLAGMVAIYVPGLLWLGQLFGWDQPILAWGLWPFLPGEALKLALAALLIPGLWRLAGPARG